MKLRRLALVLVPLLVIGAVCFLGRNSETGRHVRQVVERALGVSHPDQPPQVTITFGKSPAGRQQPGTIPKTQRVGPLWSSTPSKSAAENANGHWLKHRGEFPEYRNAEEYIDGAHSFFLNPPSGTLRKVSRDGDRLYYNPSNNTFGVQAGNGAPRTMFRPDSGMSYWKRQK